jgi:4-amino-4-deoxy-L-arabinose transferase-like glycosyltransferase
MRHVTAGRVWLLMIIAGYVFTAGLYAVYTPDWQAPDEPAHYNYIRQIAETGQIPIIELGDWDQAYLDQLKGSAFDPVLLDRLPQIQYEDHQPPLYYLLGAPIYTLSNGNLTALRWYSVSLGIGIVLCAFCVGRVIVPAHPPMALAMAAFIAFLPQHVAILGSVNNDALGWLIADIILLASLMYVQDSRIRPWMLGLMVGVALVTKATAYIMAAVALLAVLLRWRRSSTAPRVLVREAALLLIPALLIGGLWWLRNVDVYGFPDVMGLAAHDAVVIGQPRTAEGIDRLGFSAYVREGLNTTFNSFWGQFGWMGVPLPSRYYLAIQIALIAAFAGLLIALLRQRRSAVNPSDELQSVWIRRDQGLLLGTTAALSVVAFLYYNTEFQQFQGRYLYPLLIPLAAILALGVDGWRAVIEPLLPSSWRSYWGWITALVFLPMMLFALWLLWRVVVPNL